MCWTSKPNATKQVAIKPIIVRKVMKKDCNNKIYSPYRNYRYFRFIPYFTKLEITRYSIYTKINRGFHSYSSECTLYYNIDSSITVSINGQLLTDYPVGCKYVIKKFLIPPGATYYKNERGEIVSNCIIML